MSGITTNFESLYDDNGSIKSRCFYCDVTKSDYEIVSSKAHHNSGYHIIGMEHRVKRLRDGEIRVFQEHELKRRFIKVQIKKC